MILVDVRDALSAVPERDLPAAAAQLASGLSQLTRVWHARVAAVVEPAHGLDVADGGALAGVRIHRARPRATPARIAELLLGPLAARDVLVVTSCPRAERLARSCGARVASSRALWLSLRSPTLRAPSAAPPDADGTGPSRAAW